MAPRTVTKEGSSPLLLRMGVPVSITLDPRDPPPCRRRLNACSHLPVTRHDGGPHDVLLLLHDHLHLDHLFLARLFLHLDAFFFGLMDGIRLLLSHLLDRVRAGPVRPTAPDSTSYSPYPRDSSTTESPKSPRSDPGLDMENGTSFLERDRTGSYCFSNFPSPV